MKKRFIMTLLCLVCIGFVLSIAPAGAINAGYFETAAQTSYPMEVDLKYDLSGNPGIVFRNDDSFHIQYSYKTNGVWNTELVADRGGIPSLTYDKSGRACIIYNGSEGLRLSVREGENNWKTTIIDSGASKGKCTIELSNSGQLCAAYLLGDRDIYYAVFNGTNWTKQKVETVAGYGYSYRISLAFDGATPVLAYGCESGLRYARQNGSGWSIETVDSSSKAAYDVDMAYGNGTPHISYSDENNKCLKYAFKNSSGWGSKTLGSLDYPDFSSRIAILGDRIYIAYVNYILNGTTTIKLLSKSFTGSEFTSVDVLPKKFGNIPPFIDMEINNTNPSIAYSAYRAGTVSLIRMQPDIEASSCDFGGVASGSSNSREITVTNNGSIDLKIESVDLKAAGSFTVTGSLETTIPSGQSKVLTVTFKPTEIGKSYDSSIEIKSNDPDESTFTIPLKGHTYSNNADLTSLSFNGGSSLLQSGTTDYSLTVQNNVDSAVITPAAADSYASIKVNDTTVQNGKASGNIPLQIGPNSITIEVTTEDGSIHKTYTLNINRKDSPNANLSRLSISNHLDKPFSQDVTAYSVTLDHADEITITPTSAESRSVITINGETVSSGNESSPIHFDEGTSTVVIHVLAPDKETSKDYTLTVKRLPALGSISLSRGSLFPTFASNKQDYTVTVPNTINNIKVTPITLEDYSSVYINNNVAYDGKQSDPIDLLVGENVINIEVKSKDLTLSRIYTVKVNRLPCLSSLSLSSGNLNMPFDSGTVDYTVTVPNNIDKMAIKPGVAEGSTIKVNSSSVNSGESSETALAEGKNIIKIEVTSPDGKASITYTINVKRLPMLDSLILNNGALDFNKETFNYTVNVPNNITSMKLKPSVKAGSTVYIKGSKVESGIECSEIALNEGINSIDIEVRSADGEATVTYNLSVKRLSGLANLSVSKGNLVFKSGTFNYEVTVPNSVSGIKLTPEAPEGISIKIAGNEVESGEESALIPLAEGDNGIAIEAVSGNEGSTLYSVIVKRLPVLTGLSINESAVKLEQGVTDYEITLPNSISKIKLVPDAAEGTNIKINGTLVNSGENSPEILMNSGNNTISIIITSADGKVTSTYTFTIKRLPGLNGISLSTGTLTPEFDTDTMLYNTYVSNSVESITLRPVPAEAGSIITVNGKELLNGAESDKIKLLLGRNDVITVKITSPDGVAATYKLSVYRAYPPAPPEKHEVIVPGSDSETKVSVNVNKSNGIVTVNLNDLKENIMNNKKNPLIEVPAIEGTLTYTLELTVTSLSDNQKGNSLTFSTETGSVIVPDNMLNGIDEINGTKTAISIGQGDKSLLPKDLRETIGDRPVVQLSLEVDGRQFAWNNPDAPVTVSVPYKPTSEELANPENITVWYIDGSGKVVQVPSGRYDPKTGMVTFTTTHFSEYAVVYVQKSFDDLENAAWAKKSVEVLASKGILKGITDSEYAPKTNISRADFLCFLIRTLGLNAEVDGNFQDIDSEAYYYKEIAIAKKLGITGGTGNNKFSPDAGITRQDMMALTARALKAAGKLNHMGTASELKKFDDRSLISSYAVDSAATVVKEGLIAGSGGKINPLGNTTRAEAAVLLYRIYNKYTVNIQ